jgi:hypothetical protein
MIGTLRAETSIVNVNVHVDKRGFPQLWTLTGVFW